jgi:hypothetical protein
MSYLEFGATQTEKQFFLCLDIPRRYAIQCSLLVRGVTCIHLGFQKSKIKKRKNNNQNMSFGLIGVGLLRRKGLGFRVLILSFFMSEWLKDMFLASS